MSLNKEKQEKLKKKLLQEKEDIEGELEDLKESLDFGDDVDSGDEETDETEEYSNYIDVKRTLDARSESIDKALGKMDEGTYGICESCEEDIDEEVLEANPASVLCRECKKQA